MGVAVQLVALCPGPVVELVYLAKIRGLQDHGHLFQELFQGLLDQLGYIFGPETNLAPPFAGQADSRSLASRALPKVRQNENGTSLRFGSST